MINDIHKEAESKMRKSLESLMTDLAKMRTGRAHPSLLDHIRVESYGAMMPLCQVATVSVSDARTLTITPWDKSMVALIEKAIMQSELGLNPSSAGTVIRVPLPQLTEQRRKDLIKIIRGEGEGARVAIRSIRRDANSHIKELLKEKMISEDEERKAEEAIQKLTDKYIADIDKHLESKEKELMEV